MIQLDYRSGVPIYDQLINGIVKMKMLGALNPGQAMPSVRSLAKQLGINPNTVQRAYALLEEKGIIYSVTGKGSFVADDNEAQDNIISISLKEFRNAVLEAKRLGIGKEKLIEVATEIFEEDIK